MGNIYLIRHGFTPANNANYNNQRGLSLIASDEDMPLDRIYGVSQALELGSFLNGIRGKSLILVSPYKRTRETLDYAMQNMNGEFDVMIVDDLKEINSGVCYAKTREEIIEEDDGALGFFEEFDNDPFNTPYLGGESFYDVMNRVSGISLKIKELSDEYDNIFVFDHGTVNKCIFYNLYDCLYDYQKNCEVIKANGEDMGTSVFVPVAWAPKGYTINIDEYLKGRQLSKKMSTKNS